MTPLRWVRHKRFWLLLLGGILVALIGSKLPLNEGFNALKGWLVSLGVWAMPAFVLLYLTATVLGLPNILLILVAGAIFGLTRGVLAVSIADTLGAIACFWVGRTLARDRIQRWMQKHPHFANLDQAVARKGWKILLLTRLSPLIPSNVLNYGFSCTRVNFWQYCFFSWLGMLPMIGLYVYIGSFGLSLLQGGPTPGKLALQSGGAATALVAGLYVSRVVRRSLQPKCPSNEN